MQLNILLQATGQSGISSIVMIVLMIVVFYFFLIRPQKKRQKEIQEFQNSVKNGTKVVTSGGIYGTVKDVKDKYFIVEIADNVRISVDKASVFAVPATEEKK
ncbi:MAG: preprotein translocase subunit YajC [Paludibacteraceae bacterium]|nr:preprotein translocase subunit YajC [Paludibacteraceae bacterium]MCR5298662.1 preprotein translocase subunit YajC [Paludibacteraceae bacterium]